MRIRITSRYYFLGCSMLYQYILLVAVVIVPSSSLSTIGSQGATTARPRFFDGLVWRVYLPNSGHPVVQLVVNFILGAVIRPFAKLRLLSWYVGVWHSHGKFSQANAARSVVLIDTQIGVSRLRMIPDQIH